MTYKETEAHQAQIDNMNAQTAKLKAEAAYLEAQIKAAEKVQETMEAMQQTAMPEAIQWAMDVKDSYLRDKEEAISAIEDMADADGTISFGEEMNKMEYVDKEEYVDGMDIIDAQVNILEDGYDTAFWNMLEWLSSNKLDWRIKKHMVEAFMNL